jgi:hypothetical protein
MKKIASQLLAVISFVLLISPAAFADDEDDVRAVIAQYVATESSDLTKQATLMTDDREYITGGIRTTNNAANMRGQIAAQKRNQAMDPNTQVIVTIDDLHLRMYSDVATASFFRFINVVLSAEAIAAGRTASPNRQIVSMVLAKVGRDWKIVQTHQSPLGGN